MEFHKNIISADAEQEIIVCTFLVLNKGLGVHCNTPPPLLQPGINSRKVFYRILNIDGKKYINPPQQGIQSQPGIKLQTNI